MDAQKPLHKPPALPGTPCITDRKTGRRETVAHGRIIRNRSGQPMLCKNSVEGQMIANAAGKFICRPLVLVRFEGKGGKRIEQAGFATDGGGLPHSDVIAIEAMIFLAGEQRAKSRARWKALTPPTGKGQ